MAAAMRAFRWVVGAHQLFELLAAVSAGVLINRHGIYSDEFDAVDFSPNPEVPCIFQSRFIDHGLQRLFQQPYLLLLHVDQLAPFFFA